MITKATFTGGFFVCVQKSYTDKSKPICQYGIMSDVFVITGVSEGTKAKLMRIARGLRQIDVATAARVDTIDITRLEKDRYVLPTRRKRILTVLGLLDEEAESA